MNLIIVCVRDRAADTFGRPFYVKAVGEAIRSFSDEINRPAENNQLNQHPEDFDLYQIGTFNDDTGYITTQDEGPKQIAVGKDLKVKE